MLIVIGCANQPAKPMNFDTLLTQVNKTRRELIEKNEPLDISQFTQDFMEQNNTFTEEEMDILIKEPIAKKNIFSREELIEDTKTFFTLIKTTYGAYEYFGGDTVFLEIQQDIIEELSLKAEWKFPMFERILVKHLSPVLIDGHFNIGDKAMLDNNRQYMYYVPNIYFDDTVGLDTAYIKPTIGLDGAITNCFATMSTDGLDLPKTMGDYTLDWVRGENKKATTQDAFLETENQGIPVLTSSRMSAYTPEQEKQLERFSNCGSEYTDAPLLIFDVRGNGGGSDIWVNGWFEGWTGESPDPKISLGYKYSQLGYKVFSDYCPVDKVGSWGVYHSQGTWVERTGTTFVLTDKGVASSGETAIQALGTVDNVVFVGGATGGCSLVPNNSTFYLPNTGLSTYFGSGIIFNQSIQNKDDVGHLPDLWVNPQDAMEAVLRLITYYKL